MRELTEKSQDTENNTHGLMDKHVFRELEKTLDECSSDGWDGDRAKALSKEVLQSSVTFLQSFPPGIEPPQIAAEPDGAITLEWYRSPEKVISVSIDLGGEVYYAAIIGALRRHGRGSVHSGVSDDLLELIERVTKKTEEPEKTQKKSS